MRGLCSSTGGPHRGSGGSCPGGAGEVVGGTRLPHASHPPIRTRAGRAVNRTPVRYRYRTAVRGVTSTAVVGRRVRHRQNALGQLTGIGPRLHACVELASAQEEGTDLLDNTALAELNARVEAGTDPGELAEGVLPVTDTPTDDGG